MLEGRLFWPLILKQPMWANHLLMVLGMLFLSPLFTVYLTSAPAVSQHDKINQFDLDHPNLELFPIALRNRASNSR